MILAVADNALLHKPTFGGQQVDDNSLLVTLALKGDANLDGSVSFSDLGILIQHYGQIDPNWPDGNFSGDPTIGFADLGVLIQNYNATLPATLSPATPAHPTPVPEPTSLAFALLAAPLLARSRHGRRRIPQ